MTNNNFSQVAAFIWSVADLLRGDFKQSQYGRVILPFTLLRRLECVLAPTKADVLAANEKVKLMALPEEAKEKMLLKATQGLAFFNTSELDLVRLGQKDIRSNLNNYIQNFSKDAREIFEHFKFDEFTGLLDDANLLYKVVQKFATTDLSPQRISNHDMGLVFEELIRRFAESSNETAGEHFTPRDIVRLTTGLIFGEDDDALNKDGIIRTVYDPTAGTGGFLSSGTEYVREHNPDAVIRVYGQELNPESYAICKADMLIKGQDVRNIKLGNTLSNDQLAYDKFDYMLSNPPFGVDWKRIEQEIKDEHSQKGFEGRFGAGLPRVSDGSLLFLMHLMSKMRQPDAEHDQGSRIGIILNGSPLFTGSAGSGESEIRRYILEADLLEAIIALPTDMFYNTGIATYVWVLSNKKEAERKGKVHLINATNLSSKMRKSLGSKRHYLTDEEIRTITQNYGAFEAVDTLTLDGESEQQKPFSSKIFNSYEFGYRRVTIERPLRLSAQVSDDAIASLRFAPKPFNTVMQKIYDDYGTDWTEASYGQLSEDAQVEIRALIKAEFTELKEKDIKTVLEPKLWLEQRSLMRKAEALQAKIGTAQSDDFNAFDEVLKQALKDSSIKLETKEKKQFLDAVTWKNADAAPVINKLIKGKENPLYGQFSYQGKVVEFVQDGDLRDAENIALNPDISTTDLIESYFKREVLPHVPDAWMNADKRDALDAEIGIVGYEIPFNRHFYVYEPPRDLSEIDADLDAVSREIMALLARGAFLMSNAVAKYQKYAEYKDSGVEWLGEIPSHWDLRKFKHHFRSAMGETILGADLIEDGKLPVYSATEGDHFFGYVNSSSVVLDKGDFVIPARGNSIGFPKLVVTTSTCSQTTIYAKMHKKIHSKFTFYYLLGCKPYLFQFVQTAIPQITVEEVKNNHLVHPSLEEQTQIANFLDHETAKIDTLIAKQEKLIALLKEKRQAVISHAVTKGLNPNVPMKDSGVEWLGKVPEHWGVSTIGYYAKVTNGTTPSKANLSFWDKDEIPWLSSGEVNQYHINEASEHITQKALQECSLELLPIGTVVMGMIGQGKTRGLSAITKIEATINQNLAALETYSRLNNEYLHYYLQAAYVYIREEGRGGNQAALNCEIIKKFSITIPPYEEQIKIVEQIKNLSETYKALIYKAESAIKLMQERRTALISAAVTGKIDVRHWQHPNQKNEADVELSA